MPYYQFPLATFSWLPAAQLENLMPRVLRLLGQWVITRRDAGVIEEKLIFMIGC